MYFWGGKAFLLIKGEFLVSLHRKRHLGARGTLNTMFEITIYFHQCLQQCARKTGFRARYFQAVILWASCLSYLHFAFLVKKETRMRTSLVVQWLRIHLPVQGIRVPSLVWEASTCHRATEPMCCNHWSCAPQSPRSAAREATAMRSTTERAGPACHWVSLVAQTVKSLPAVQETRVCSLAQEDPLEKEMANNSSILPGKSHGQRSLAGYSPWGRKESDTTQQLHSLVTTGESPHTATKTQRTRRE